MKANFLHLILIKLLRLLLREINENTCIDTEFDQGENVPAGALSGGSVIVYLWRQKDAKIITEQLIGMNLAGGVFATMDLWTQIGDPNPKGNSCVNYGVWAWNQ